MFRVDQIDHVELFVPDRYEAARWYERVLGLSIVSGLEHWVEDPNGPLMISSDSGRSKLALFTGVPQGGRETAGFHLTAFRVSASGFLEFLEGLGDAGLRDHRDRGLTREMVVDHRAAWSIYFCDPWGHRLEVTTYDYEVVKKGLSTA